MNPGMLVATSRWAYVFADAAGRAGLWRTDGTDAGTRWLGDVSPTWAEPMMLGDTLVVMTRQPGLRGDWIASSSGTRRSTQRLVRLPVAMYTHPSLVGPAGGRLVYVNAQYPAPKARYPAVALWSTDGTRTGTRPIKFLKGQHGNPPHGNADGAFIGEEGNVYLGSLTAGDLIFFVDGGDNALWRTDGTPAGTFSVANNVRAPGSTPRLGGTDLMAMPPARCPTG
jgi:ELWxxDGT repeat protein